MYLPNNVERIDEQELLERVQALIDNGVNEDRFIEYKLMLNLGSDQEKRELCKDISGFSNARGGHILYGIEESSEGNINIVGFNISNGIDKFKLQLQSTLNSGIQPRLPGVQIKIIEGNWIKGRYLMVIGIPRSWVAPHMIIKDNDYRVYVRQNAQTEKVDIMQIRDMILEKEGLAPKIRAFRQERIEWVYGQDSPLSNERPPIIIFHVIPVNAFTSEANWDVVDCIVNSSSNSYDKLRSILDHYVNSEILPNADGVCANFTNRDGRTKAFCQYFRNGTVEMINEIQLERGESTIARGIGWNTRGLNETFESIFQNYEEMSVADEVFIAVTLIGLKGCQLEIPPRYSTFYPRTFDRNMIVFPEYIANRTNSIQDVLKPALNLIWQAAGHPKMLEVKNV